MSTLGRYPALGLADARKEREQYADANLTVRDAQAALVKSDPTAGALARCWREGVHPSQTDLEPE